MIRHEQPAGRAAGLTGRGDEIYPGNRPGSRPGGIGVAEDDHRGLPAELQRHVLDPGVRRVPLNRPAGRSGPDEGNAPDPRLLDQRARSSRPSRKPPRPGPAASARRCAAPTGAWSGALVWLAGALCYGEWPEERGREAAAALTEDGVGAGGDRRGVLRQRPDPARRRGRPARSRGESARRRGLVGVDNWQPLAISCRPPLTTVDLQLDEIGRVAAEELLGKASQRRPSGPDKWGVIHSRRLVRRSDDSRD